MGKSNIIVGVTYHIGQNSKQINNVSKFLNCGENLSLKIATYVKEFFNLFSLDISVFSSQVDYACMIFEDQVSHHTKYLKAVK